MKLKDVLNLIDLNALKITFNEEWDKNPRTMRDTMKRIIWEHCDKTKISSQTAEALLQRIEA